MLTGCFPPKVEWVAPPPNTVRLADDAPYARVHEACNGLELDRQEKMHFVDPALALAYGECTRPAPGVSGELRRFVGAKLRCDLERVYPYETRHDRDIPVVLSYSEVLHENSLWFEFSRDVEGLLGMTFYGPWAEHEVHDGIVRYHHPGENGTVGGYCEESRVLGLSHTLTLEGKRITARNEWRCHHLFAKTWHEELTCSLP